MFTRFAVLSSFFGAALSISISSLSELPLDDHGHLKNHWLLTSPGCEDLMKNVKHTEHLVQRKAATMTDELAANFIKKYSPCIAATIEKGTPAYTVANVMPQNVFSGINGFSDWLRDRRKAEVGFMHFYEDPMVVNWIDNSGRRVKLATIENSEKNTFWTHSYLGHQFECIDAATGAVLGTYLVEQNSFFVLGNSNSS